MEKITNVNKVICWSRFQRGEPYMFVSYEFATFENGHLKQCGREYEFFEIISSLYRRYEYLKNIATNG